MSYVDFLNKLKVMDLRLLDMDFEINNLLESNPAILDFSKWGRYLPKKYQAELLKEKYFDLKGAEVIKHFRFVTTR